MSTATALDSRPPAEPVDDAPAGSAVQERTRERTHAERILGLPAALAAAVQRLFRAPRPAATPAFAVFPGWPERLTAALIAAGIILAGMAYLDPAIQSLQHSLYGPAALFFEYLTDVGKSGWFLIPTGIAFLLILAMRAPAHGFRDRLALALAARIGFLFVAVAGSGLIITIVKRIIGRARPVHFDSLGAMHFDVTAWAASFASFPSGHSQTAFAIAVSLACLFPHWRRVLVGVAALVALSRVIVDAHYFTDIVVGSAWGAWFTLMTREWFARRGLVFSPTASRRPFPMPRRRLIATARDLLHAIPAAGKPR